MRDDTARRIADIDTSLSPEMVAASQDLYAAQHETPPYHGVTVMRDVPYGPHARHRLDVFGTAITSGAKPVVIFVHGGGFVAGDKVVPGTPYYDNAGLWAVRHGMIGVTITYPLAPEARYPAGAAAVGLAVTWALAHIAEYGGDPAGIVLLGQSAGATHVATYGGRPELYPQPRGGVRAIALLSGIYDFAATPMNPNALAYLGDAPDAATNGSALPGIASAGIPIMFGISEFDPAPFHVNAMALANALFAQTKRFPNVVYLPRHNHITQIAHLNASDIGDTLLSDRLAEFIGVHTARVPTNV